MKDDAEFDKWVGQWEKAMNSEDFASKNKPAEQEYVDIYGNWNKKETKIKDVDALYWDSIYQLSKGNTPKILNEKADIQADMPITKAKVGIKTEKPDGKSMGQVAHDLADTDNPIQYPSRGKDARSHITPNWDDGEDLVELHNMKKQLEKLESKMGSAYALADSKKAKNVKKQINDLKKRIDDISDKLHPGWMKDYMS